MMMVAPAFASGLRLKACHPIRVLLAFFIAAPGALAADQWARLSLGGQFARLGWEPIALRRTEENHLCLSGRLNGQRQSVLVDTGWSFTTVSTNAARQLKTQADPGATSRDPFFRPNEQAAAVLLDRLKLGPVEFVNQPALAQNLVFNGRRAPFDVVLGCDFLIRNFGVVDCLNRRLYVRHVGPSEQQQAELEATLRRSGFVAVPLHGQTPLTLAGPARVNGEPLEMLVDSAAPWTCVDVRQVERLRLKPTASPAKLTGVGRTGTHRVGVATVKSFRLADVEVKLANVAVLDLADWGLAAPDAALSEVQGLLGGEMLAAMSAVIDCHASRLWLKRPRRR
jgi:predicted aspartyl protease